MSADFQEPDPPIGLTNTNIFNEEEPSPEDSCVSTSDPLLGDDIHSDGARLKRRSVWRRRLSSVIPSRARWKTSSYVGNGSGEKPTAGRMKGRRKCLTFVVAMLVFLGLVQVLSLIGTIIVVFLPNGIHRVIKSWGHPGQIGAGLSDWPTDFTRDILPIPCHSHNDYWRAVPLYSAIEAGCISVEADIWLFKDELYVGHSIPSLTPNRTLGSLYINPLLDTLVKQNPEPGLLPDPDPSLRGVFDTVPEQSLVLLIDFKTSGSELWPQVMDALEPLREKRYLTHHDGTKLVSGPITVVGTGNTPFDMIKSEDDNPHHDVFFDAPLNEMYESAPIEERHGGEGEKGQIGSHKGPDYRSSNSYYASTDFNDAIGPLWDGSFSDHQMDLLRGQLRGAHARGLKARYWNLPFWPIHSRNYVWKVLVEEGVDMLNVDDLKGATERNWDKHTYGVQSGIDEAE